MRTSATVELISPIGPQARGSIHTGATSSGAPGDGSTWPTAARWSSASSGSVPVWVRPSGANSRSRIAASHTLPVTTSITRPRIEKPVLQYDIVAPSGWVCSSVAHEST